MDLRMPDLDGLTATRRILAEPGMEKTFVIMVTASAFENSRQAAMDEGCVDFIVKPIRAEHLFRKLQQHLHVRFVDSTERMPANEGVVIPTGRHMSELGIRLRDAASIGNVTELDHIALELSSLGSTEAAFGMHIGRLTAAFDFPALLAICERIQERNQVSEST
jgi:DNA-binding response OmpR family regulator